LNLTVLPAQAAIHRSSARFRVVDAGRRFGKSLLGGREVFAQAVIPDSYIWIVGPTLDLAEKEFRVAWKLIVDKELIPVRRKSERELFMQLSNGTTIECRSEENPDQLIGEGLDLVVCAEAARLKHRTWDQYLRPALADRRGDALLTSTPRGFNWFFDFYNRGQKDHPEFEPGWESWQIPSSANPLLSPEEIEGARRTSTPEAFAQEWEAKFISYGGLVFPEFDQNIHVRSHIYNPSLRTALWIDPGTSAPYCVLLVQITPEEEVRVLDEIYLTQHTSDRIIAIAEEKWGGYIFNDYKRPKAELEVIIDKAAAEAAATWRLRGYRAFGEKPSIKKGLEVHHQFLRDPLRSTDGNIVPRITYDPKCKNAIKEHGQYHYPDEIRKRIDTNPTENPVDVDNHTIDAVRYGYYNTFPELFNEELKHEEVQYVDYEDFDPGIRARVSLGDY